MDEDNRATQEYILAVHRGFALLCRKCPKCGDNLIWNQTGVECGGTVKRQCDYAEGGERYNYEAALTHRDQQAGVDEEYLVQALHDRGADINGELGIAHRVIDINLAVEVFKQFHPAPTLDDPNKGDASNRKDEETDVPPASPAILDDPKLVEAVASPDYWYCDADPDESGNSPYEAMHQHRQRLFPNLLQSSFIGPKKWGVIYPIVGEDGEEAAIFDTEAEAWKFCKETETAIKAYKPAMNEKE